MSWKNDQVSERETAKLLEVARECLAVPGDYVEMGCYKGDTSMLLAEVIEGAAKTLYLYDSFEGLPEKTEEDESMIGENFQAGVLAVSKREVKARFLRSGMKVPRITKAWFSDLVPEDLPKKIAFAFLDGDLYNSIRNSLALVSPKLSAGGAMVVHDYNNSALPGVTRAVDEFLARNEKFRMNYTCGLATLRS